MMNLKPDYNFKSHIERYLIIILLLLPTVAKGEGISSIYDAEEIDTSMSRPVTGAYSIELGGISFLSTYLSPLRYQGTTYSLSGYWSKAMPFNPEHAIMEFKLDGNFSSLLNPAQTSRMV